MGLVTIKEAPCGPLGSVLLRRYIEEYGLETALRLILLGLHCRSTCCSTVRHTAAAGQQLLLALQGRSSSQPAALERARLVLLAAVVLSCLGEGYYVRQWPASLLWGLVA